MDKKNQPQSQGSNPSKGATNDPKKAEQTTQDQRRGEQGREGADAPRAEHGHQSGKNPPRFDDRPGQQERSGQPAGQQGRPGQQGQQERSGQPGQQQRSGQQGQQERSGQQGQQDRSGQQRGTGGDVERPGSALPKSGSTNKPGAPSYGDQEPNDPRRLDVDAGTGARKSSSAGEDSDSDES